MNFANFAIKNFVLPASDTLLRRDIANQMDFLDISQWWTRDQIDDYQNKKLRLLVAHAYQNVPYYRQTFDAIKLKPSDIMGKADLHKIPILSKKDIHQNFPDNLVAANIKKKTYSTKSSSGSTGQQTKYFITNNAYGFNIACNMRGWHWMGYQWGDKFIKVTQNERHSPVKKLQDFVNRCTLFTHAYSDESMQEFIDLYRRYQPLFLRSYPDPLLFIAKYLRKHNIRLAQVSGINTTGNILFGEARQLIEETFGAKISDSYSCEGGAVVFECPTHSCYHVAEEYGIIEILDKDGQAVAAGEEGRSIVTDLSNYATPFLRYDSQDILVRSSQKCSCGRSLMAIESIKGRDNDILVTPAGEYLIAQTFTTYFKHIPTIEQFQVHQKDVNHFVFKLVTNQSFSPDTIKSIIEYWQKVMGKQAKIDVVIADEIDLLTSGKRRFLIREKHIKLEL